MMTMAYLDLLLVYMRIYILFSTIPENQMIFVLYSAAVQMSSDQSTVTATQHLNKYVLSTDKVYTSVRTHVFIFYVLKNLHFALLCAVRKIRLIFSQDAFSTIYSPLIFY